MNHNTPDPGEGLGRIAARNARMQAAKAQEPGAAPKVMTTGQKLWDFFSPLIFGVIAVIIIRTFIITPIRVDGSSMVPTLVNNERMLVTRYERFFKLPEYGQVVICHFDLLNEQVVKRVVGKEGDVIELRAGMLYRNGEAVDEPYIKRPTTMNFGPVTVAEDSVFVMGDNRPESHDSRIEGSIPRKNVLGNVVTVFYPFGDMRIVR